MQEARSPDVARYVSYDGTSEQAGKHLEADIKAIDGGLDNDTRFDIDVGATRSIVPDRQATLKEMLGEFVVTDTTVAVTSRSKFPSIEISDALSAAKITEPMTNKSAPTPRASGSRMELPRILTFLSVIVLIPVIPTSPLVA